MSMPVMYVGPEKNRPPGCRVSRQRVGRYQVKLVRAAPAMMSPFSSTSMKSALVVAIFPKTFPVDGSTVITHDALAPGVCEGSAGRTLVAAQSTPLLKAIAPTRPKWDHSPS